jgi:pyruvate dehydrogenase E2 component (dihydrolipoamide acetyltransferase)
MDVPSPADGVIKQLKVKVGDKVSEGALIVILEPSAVSPAAPAKPAVLAPVPEPAVRSVATTPMGAPPRPGQGEEVNAPPPVVLMPGPAEMVAAVVGGPRSHASPSVRRYARELGVDVSRVKGTGPKDRILKEDVQAFVKAVLTGARPAGAGGLDIVPWPKVDFAKFGSFETRPLSRIRKISGANLARNWVMIPHVTQFDETDITAVEQLRVRLNKQYEAEGVKLTVLAFLIKAVVDALKQFPEVNSSIDGDNLVLKHYYHIGFAADTPNGLVVPVIRDADRKSLADIAREAAGLAKKARDGRLSPVEMQGGCFSISSLGGIGGTLFTPIINAPEVAILGVSRAEFKPKWDGKKFVPRLILPLSLSYDHRVVDGASGARFITFLGQALTAMGEAMPRAAAAGRKPAPKAKRPAKKKTPKKKPKR